MVRTLDQSKTEQKRRTFLFLSIFLNLGLLAYFKYANFFVDNLQQFVSLFSAHTLRWTQVALPIGISFYTFQTLTYSIDIYRRKSKPLTRVSDYMLYIMMFPQLIAGPIVRYNQIEEQIRNRVENYSDKLYGFFRFNIGLAKKVLIANTIGAGIDPYFDTISNLDTPTAWLVIIGYAFQIYFDFSGYSDMAIGLGRMMGFRFPENFNSPYISRSISEFWRRWHITLGDWMRDYLYIPLGGNRVSSKVRVYFNLSFVFLMSGLWHGASWNFVLWGIFHGVFLILDRLFLMRYLDGILRPMSVLFTFVLVLLSWVIFRIEAFPDALEFYSRLFAFEKGDGFECKSGFWLAMMIAVGISFSTITRFGQSIEANLLKVTQNPRNLSLRLLVSFAVFFICLAEIATSNFNPFIYFRF